MHDHTLPGPWIILHMMKWLASAESFSPFEEKALCVRISSKSARPRCFVTPAGTIVKFIYFYFFFNPELREVVSFCSPRSNISSNSCDFKME